MATDRLTPIRIRLDSVLEEEHRPRESILGSMPLYYYRNNTTANLAVSIVVRRCLPTHFRAFLVNWIILNNARPRSRKLTPFRLFVCCWSVMRSRNHEYLRHRYLSISRVFSCRSFRGSNLELYEKVILRCKGTLLVKEKLYAHYFFILYRRITIFQKRINEITQRREKFSS